jgi:predicted MFS family arabinose efflux permease
MFSAFGIASGFGSSLTKALSASYGWAGTFNVLAVLSVLATVIVSQLTPIKALPSSAV